MTRAVGKTTAADGCRRYRAQVTRTRLAIPAVLLAATLTGCGGSNTPEEPSPAAAPTNAAAQATPVSGLPPRPDAATQAAYIAALRAIDPDIIGGKDERTIVDRGRNQCLSIRNGASEAKLIEQTNIRFTAPGHPDGFGEAKAKKILEVVRKHLCP